MKLFLAIVLFSGIAMATAPKQSAIVQDQINEKIAQLKLQADQCLAKVNPTQLQIDQCTATAADGQVQLDQLNAKLASLVAAGN